MNSIHLKTLLDSFESVIKSVLKEKIGNYYIRSSSNIESIGIQIKTDEQHFKIKKIKFLSNNLIEFEDNSSIILDNINNLQDLLSILVYTEEWLILKENESFKIEWSIDDFEDCALRIEEDEEENVLPLFDRSKFPLALRILEDHYDCNLGINWNDIEFYLNHYCKL